MGSTRGWWLGLLVLGSSAARVAAEDFTEDLTEEDAELQIHGFVSQGALLSTDNNYLARTERGSLEFAEAGINVTKALGDRVRIGMQLFTRDLGPEGNYTARFDWFNLDYRWRDWLGMRAGRNKLPFGLYNDTIDIDAAHPVILLPASVYPQSNRDLLLAQTGVEVYGYKQLGALGALDYRVYGGSAFFAFPSPPGTEIQDVDMKYVYGGRVMWETPAAGLRVGGSSLSGAFDVDFLAGDVPGTLQIRSRLWLASLEYAADDLTFAAEYGRHHSKARLGELAQTSVQEFGYGLAAYRWRSWLQTALYYSLMYPDVENRVGSASRQHDAALSWRFDITQHWLLKVEGHMMRGTALINPALDNPSPVHQWWLLAAKVTAYF